MDGPTVWSDLKDITDGLSDIINQIDTGGKVAGGDAIVIDQAVFDQVASEQKLIDGLSLSNVPLDDPWAGGVSLTALTGADLKESLEEANRIQGVYDQLDANIQKLSNEIKASGTLLEAFQTQTDAIHKLYDEIDKHLDEFSGIFGENIPYWWHDLDNLQFNMRGRDNHLADKIKQGEKTLTSAKKWRDEHAVRHKDVDRWVQKIISSQIEEQRGQTFDRIYKRVKELAGAGTSETDARMLSGILTAMMADDDRVRKVAEDLRANAEVMRSTTRVGKGMIDLVLGLASIGAGTVGPSGGQAGVDTNSIGDVDSTPNSILIYSEDHPLFEYKPPVPIKPPLPKP